MEINSLDCPKCGGSIPEQIRRGKLFKCPHCGSTLVWPDKQATLVLSFGANLCPDCGVDNEPTRSFCRNCGTSLTKTCPQCKATLYVGDSYCPNGHDFEYLRQRHEYEQQRLGRAKWYLDFIDTNLITNGYTPIQIPEADKAFYRSEFRLVTATTEHYCIFRYFNETLTPDKVRSTSEQGFRHAEELKTGTNLRCYPVIVTDNVPSNVRDFIRSYNPKHFSAIEFPVIVELASGELYYYTGTPLYGFAVYGGIRNNAENLFRFRKSRS